MCFSATASMVAGGSLTAGGAFVLTREPTREELPFAAIPILFGLQQTIEGVVWLSFDSRGLNEAATFAYSLFSHVLWPILVPIAILLLEHDPVRKRILRVIAGVGLAVGLYLLYFLIKDGITSSIVNSSIDYNSPHLYLPLVLTLYVLATCLSGLVSSWPMVRLLGAVMLTAFLVTGLVFRETFISVWCFFAAVLSVLVYGYFRARRNAGHEPALALPGDGTLRT